jgi:tRNA acetyltransferase TAN1
MWPIEGRDSSANNRYRVSDAEENEDDLEMQIAKEVAALKRPKVEKRFGRWS